MSRHIHIDPFSGIAGDMLLAALLDLGAPLEPVVEAVAGAPFPGVHGASLATREVTSHGVRGRRLSIHLAAPAPTGGQPYPVLRSAIADAPAAPRARQRALSVLEALAAAESRVRGVAVEQVQFHELGGFDTVLDLLGTAVALDLLGVDSLSCGPLPLTRGQLRTSQGTLPVPAPATLELLKGVPCTGLDLEWEAVTPTGAALAVTLAGSFGPCPELVVRETGAGFGTGELSERPNCLRLVLGETAAPGLLCEALVLLETNLDDLSAEILATLIDRCLAAGALDAWLTPVLMKKGRPAQVLSALCPPARAAAVQEALFVHSSALGVRRRLVSRDSLPRSWREVATPWGTVRVKEASLAGRVVNRAPEFEDCRALAEQSRVAVKDVYAAALAAAARP